MILIDKIYIILYINQNAKTLSLKLLLVQIQLKNTSFKSKWSLIVFILFIIQKNRSLEIKYSERSSSLGADGLVFDWQLSQKRGGDTNTNKLMVTVVHEPKTDDEECGPTHLASEHLLLMSTKRILSESLKNSLSNPCLDTFYYVVDEHVTLRLKLVAHRRQICWCA